MSTASSHFINRELSWLAFNERVLEEAARESLPLLERVKFLAISASNMDEFYMVRVGGLQFLKDTGKRIKDSTGLTPTQQLSAIRERTLAFIERQYELLNGELLPELRKNGIHRVLPLDLTPGQRLYLQDYFNEQIFPVLSPIAIDPEAKPIVLPALQLILMSEVQTQLENGGKQIRHVVFILPANMPRHISLPEAEGVPHAYITLEDAVELFLHAYFPQERLIGTARLRISRNSDITLDDEGATDIAAEMEEILDARKSSNTIRLEIEKEDDVTPSLIKAIQRLCGATAAHTYMIPGELDLRAYFSIAGLSGFEKLKVESWPTSEIRSTTNPDASIFDLIKEGDMLLHHPYESFEPVIQLVEQAAADPNVIAIKQILYRTAKNSRIITALIKAAEAGKHVTVLVELKARFDEARNLERAEELLNAGAQIIYGVRGLKTHAKITLVMRRESSRMVRYCHFGTGNYNEATAKLYTDVSYLTRRPEYGADASAFFNTVTGRSRFVHFNKISMAPFGLRERLLEMIQSETDRAKQGEPAEMMLKMNSLEDQQMIAALYEASKAGVDIKLSVRGICCLRPGVKGLSENIRVISIIDRYLEHARIFWFSQGGNPVVFIASADFMNRNLSKRVELLTPVEDPEAKKKLQNILEIQFQDEAQAQELDKDGVYSPVIPSASATTSKGKAKLLRSQEYYAKQAAKKHRSRSQSPDLLVPHVPK